MNAHDTYTNDAIARAVWIGPSDAEELTLARRAVEARLETIVLAPDGIAASVTTGLDHHEPLLACLAADGPRQPVHETALQLARRWPLCRFVAVGSSLCEGRRRSGPPLPGVEEIPWHELPGRLECWLEDAQSRRPGWLGQPATFRREDRLLEGIRPRAVAIEDESPRRTVAVAAARQESLEGLTELLASFGSPPIEADVCRPSMETAADVVLWECPESAAGELPWLKILAAHRPATDIVLLESFPRGDRTLEAIRAGAAWVLGRPTPADVLLGTLRWLARGSRRSGLGQSLAAG